MNVKQVVEELKTLYPGKKIFMDDEENPGEIICEIDPAIENPDKSVAIAVIDKSVTHFHGQTTGEYEVLRGNLMINKNGKQHNLVPGQKLTIKPGERHNAEGHETWIKVTSNPPWNPDDHILPDK